jgi:hypothetical protein
MRKSFDGLLGTVKQQLQVDPLSGHLVLLVNTRRDSPMAMLRGWSGFLQADAFSGYGAVMHNSDGRIIDVVCRVYARRYFEQAIE